MRDCGGGRATAGGRATPLNESLLPGPPHSSDAERSRGQSWWEQPLIWEEHGTILLHKGLGRYKGNEKDLTDLLALVDVVVINMGNEYGGDDLEGYEWRARAPRSNTRSNTHSRP